jgi:HAD superfamily hydrolase (TIGR01490 family)
MKTIAIFDLDKTLIPFDCDEAWGRHMHTLGYTGPDFLSRQQAFFEQYDAGTLDIHEYQRFAMEATLKAGPLVARQELMRFVQTSIRPHIATSVLQLLDSHRQQGHHLLVITATNAFVSRAVVDALVIEDLLAIDLVPNTDGWLTGAILGIPTFQEGKVKRLQRWLTIQGWHPAEVQTYFYSDSVNDLPLLEWADHAVATNPSAALREHANLRGWPVLTLFTA